MKIGGGMGDECCVRDIAGGDGEENGVDFVTAPGGK